MSTRSSSPSLSLPPLVMTDCSSLASSKPSSPSPAAGLPLDFPGLARFILCLPAAPLRQVLISLIGAVLLEPGSLPDLPTQTGDRQVSIRHPTAAVHPVSWRGPRWQCPIGNSTRDGRTVDGCHCSIAQLAAGRCLILRSQQNDSRNACSREGPNPAPGRSQQQGAAQAQDAADLRIAARPAAGAPHPGR